MNNILETDNLTKKFGNQIVVDEISMSIVENSIYGLLGPNGAGKTTTLKMLVGLLRPTNGNIKIFGEPWKRDHLNWIGSLIENPSIYGNLTAEENLLIHAKLMNLSKECIYEVLETVNLKDTGKKRAAQFSLGMKQRLGIAIALLGNPKLLILDEPTNGLDPLGIQELRELIRSFPERGITVIISSHILNEISQIAGIVGIINGGKLKFQGEIKQGDNIEELFINVVKERGV